MTRRKAQGRACGTPRHPLHLPPVGRRTGNLLAKPNDGAYVSLSHLGRFRVIDPLSSASQDEAAPERAERTDARARRAPFPPPSLRQARGVCGRKARMCVSGRWPAGATLRRAAGALNGAPRMATRSSPPSFRVAMSESPALISTVTTQNSPAVAARLRCGEVPGSAFAPSRSFPFFVKPQPIGAVRAAETLLTRASRAALSRRERIYHVKQDDYRRLPPGRDPGGCPEG